MNELEVTLRQYLSQYRAGDEGAFELLRFAVKEDIAAYVRKKVKNDVEAEEIVDWVFERARKTICGFDEKKGTTIVHYLRGVAWHTIGHYYRSAKHKPTWPLPEDDEGVLVSAPSPEELIKADQERRTKEEISKEVWSALRQIPFRQRRVLILRHFKGRSVADIADEMDVSREAVRQLHYRGAVELRRLLATLRPEPRGQVKKITTKEE